MYRSQSKIQAVFWCVFLTWCVSFLTPTECSEPQKASSTNSGNALADFRIPGIEVQLVQQSLILRFESGFASKTITLPRIAAPVKNLSWIDRQGMAVQSKQELKLQPEPTSWLITWETAPENAVGIQVSLDALPRLISECGPLEPAADGSFYLPAHEAKTQGEKIRYEPQPFKNTVGYWAGAQDSAAWHIHALRPGKFNIELLQGCGAGYGGSTAVVEIIQRSASGEPKGTTGKLASSMEFEVFETGHFQNFVWRHLGEIELPEPGVYEVRFSPKRIKKAALMDVRAVHLIRLP